jgi:DNA-binding SARP family transcriptional activator
VQRLTAALAVRGTLSRAEAVGLLWPQSGDARARGNLRTLLWRVGKLCPGLVDPGTDRLSLARSVDVDVRSFVTASMPVIERVALTDAELMAAPRAGAGELLPDWFDDWVIIERERLRQLRLHVLERVALVLGERGRHAAAIETALEAVRLEPLRESAQRTLIVLHLGEGNLIEAIRRLDSFGGLLQAEIGADPSPELRRLVDAAVRLDLGATPVASAGPAPLV